MNSRTTWLWLVIASVLFGFIFLSQKYLKQPEEKVLQVLPGLQPAQVDSVQLRPAGELSIRAVRTNAAWTLTEPISYPAQADSIENLLLALQRLAPATVIAGRELRERPQAEQDYGFASPMATIVISQTNGGAQVIVGSRTAPGDQVFVRVVGREGVFVVGADLLEYLPRTVSDWRDTTFVDLRGTAPDLITVTNAGRFFELQREAGNLRWRITRPSPARADTSLVEEALQRLATLRISRFVSDDPTPDLDFYGLQNPELTVRLQRGTNLVTSLFFGASPTNNNREVFARLSNREGIYTVPKHHLDPWRASVNELRERRLLTSDKAIAAITVRADEEFTLALTNGQWKVMPQNLAADPVMVTNFLKTLAGLQVVQFVKDVVTEPDLPAYGLAQPSRQYLLFSAEPPAGTNVPTPFLELQFGTNQEDRVFARRTDENSVYAVRLQDFRKLPSLALDLRDRQIWNFKMDEVERAVVRQNGKVRQIIRNAAHSWALPPGSQGILNDLAVEETVKGLSQLSAWAWTARGEVNRDQFGFQPQGLQLTLEMKDGRKLNLEFGKEAPSGFPYAQTMVDGQPYVFEFPWPLYRDVVAYLSIPENVP